MKRRGPRDELEEKIGKPFSKGRTVNVQNGSRLNQNKTHTTRPTRNTPKGRGFIPPRPALRVVPHTSPLLDFARFSPDPSHPREPLFLPPLFVYLVSPFVHHSLAQHRAPPQQTGGVCWIEPEGCIRGGVDDFNNPAIIGSGDLAVLNDRPVHRNDRKETGCRVRGRRMLITRWSRNEAKGRKNISFLGLQ